MGFRIRKGDPVLVWIRSHDLETGHFALRRVVKTDVTGKVTHCCKHHEWKPGIRANGGNTLDGQFIGVPPRDYWPLGQIYPVSVWALGEVGRAHANQLMAFLQDETWATVDQAVHAIKSVALPAF